ncbi:MAG: beta-lactamase family protein, partial [Candidatus Marinimicrobia bacterium]|nr:beta-lactamase family protein [Candidatus Neomarinimicrobiota bacterium]
VGTTVAMKLVEDRYLVLDEPLHNYFPQFAGKWKDQVTARHLLTHSSGLPEYNRYWEIGLGPEQVLDHILSTELEYAPGTQYVYSDLGMILFTALAELTAGRDFSELASEWVFDPMGMSVTSYNPPAELLDRIIPTEVDQEGRTGLIHGEVHDGNTHFLGGVSAHAGAFSSARELARLGVLYLGGGFIAGQRLLEEETIEAFVQPQEMPAGSGRALGWQMASSTAHAGGLLSESAFGHTGYTGTCIWIDPEKELIVVLLTNRVHPTRDNNRIRAVRQRFIDEIVKALPGNELKALAIR